ncbi:methylated-DNA--[protein]-cysteine S-methyltransferase [Wolbachia endosymbiont of Folsomia candida]|uniref:methylated-DNA--[protein]-cysteine S-methyltransferase n=1 Tax=Wolbachia endosymbiont of Folsomia candida TaxID=169402 RepID=UPI000AF5AFE4|nr:methylated-DNA--[protein]-cysteine S-methyltransferase [Wolbachia endosymbiont of Folsomia candida]APR98742.1 methylated-DNA--[protein]-cysteine S-methyltransferase [Wolbachia endosymbiont of Folsomia candida]
MIIFKPAVPREYKSSLKIFYGLHSTLFGKCLIGVAQEGICHLSFVDTEVSSIEVLKKAWPQAQLKQDIVITGSIIQNVFMGDSTSSEKMFYLFVKGTDFQVKVWQALVSMPKGITTSYENIAHMVGNPKAVRAAANAIANNPIAYLIPCHRVISKSGAIHKYRWGVERKRAILAYEQPRKTYHIT